MEAKPNFYIKEKISKKGNRVICLHYFNNDVNIDFPWIMPNDKFKTIVQIKTIADNKKFEKYLDMTIENVFQIIINTQNWDLIPYKFSNQPIVLNPIFIVDNINNELINKFFIDNPKGEIFVSDVMISYNKAQYLMLKNIQN